MIREAIEAIVNERRDLTEAEASGVMREIMRGEATAAQIGGFLIALRTKGETVDEITGMARVMRQHALTVNVDGLVVDTCGTGGDGQGTFNVSTAAAFVAAGAGAMVAKHGNRSMSSACGSADVLEALGAKIDLTPDQVARSIKETGIGFMFAQAFHPAMKHVAGPRRELGVRTVFNILGPLTNPAGAQAQVLGVARLEIGATMAAVLQRLGSHRALVVHGHGGVDELSLSGPSVVNEIREGWSRQYEVSPEEFGLVRMPLESVRGGSPEENADALRSVLKGKPGPLRDIVSLNAAAALVAVGLTDQLADGVRAARKAIDSGEAERRLDAFLAFTQNCALSRENLT